MSTSLPPDSFVLTEFSPPPLVDQPLTCPYRVVKGNNGNYGDRIYVAARDIKAGELIFQSAPDIVWNKGEELNTTVEQIKALSPEKRRIFDSLKPQIHPSVRGIHRAVAMGNKFLDRSTSYGFDVTSTKRVLILSDAHFTVSCRPNCAQWGDEDARMTMWTIAIHDIAKGSPLTKYRLPDTAPYEERRAFYKWSYGLVCRCEKCSLNPAERALSDSRLLRIRANVGQQLGLVEFIRRCKDNIQLYQEEGLYNRMGIAAYKALEVCIWFGDLENSKLWMERYLDLDIVGTGVWSMRYRSVEALEGDPTLHTEWRKKIGPGHETVTLEGPF